MFRYSSDTAAGADKEKPGKQNRDSRRWNKLNAWRVILFLHSAEHRHLLW